MLPRYSSFLQKVYNSYSTAELGSRADYHSPGSWWTKHHHSGSTTGDGTTTPTAGGTTPTTGGTTTPTTGGTTTPTTGGTTTPMPLPTPGVNATIGSGSDSLALKITQDAYQGDSQYAIYVDGKQIGATLTAKALHGSGETDSLQVKGDWAAGSHTVSVKLVNDLWSGTNGGPDRNIYVESATFNGAPVPGSKLDIYDGGAPKSFTVTDTTAVPGSTTPTPTAGGTTTPTTGGTTTTPTTGGTTTPTTGGTTTPTTGGTTTAPGDPSAGSNTGIELARHDGVIKTTHDGQVIENLDIYSNGTGIEVTHDNVIIRNVRVHHADGDGIYANGANNLLIENVEVINTDPPTGQNPEESSDFNNIELLNSPDATIHNVTVREGSSGIYVVLSPRADIDHVDGYDFHGPMPRGQFVQFNNSPDSSLKNFYVYNDPNGSHVADGVSVYASPRVQVENGVIDGNNMPTGAAVQVEEGSFGTTVKNVDAIHMGNAGFSAWESDDVTFTDVRTFDSIKTDQGRGLPSSGGIEFIVYNANGVVYDHATYTRPGNPGNIAWDVSKAELFDAHADPTATPMSHDAFANQWHWIA